MTSTKQHKFLLDIATHCIVEAQVQHDMTEVFRRGVLEQGDASSSHQASSASRILVTLLIAALFAADNSC
jgi:hypothetical protein